MSVDDSAPETIWATMPTDRILKSETMYGWQLDSNTDDWDQEDDYGDPCELVEYRRKDTPPTLKQAMELPEVKALIEALELAEEYWQLGALNAPLGMIQNVARTRQTAIAKAKGQTS